MNNFIAMRSFIVYLLDSIYGAKIKKEILLWYIPTVSKNSFFIFCNISIQEKTERNKIMHNNIQFDTNQVNVLYEIQINTTKRENIVLRTVTNRLAS